MGGFFNNPYMMYREDNGFDPDAWWEQPDVFGGGGVEQDLGFAPRSEMPDAGFVPGQTMPDQGFGPRGPRTIPPRMSQDRPMYDQYLETLRGIPVQKQASTWDKIFAGIAGVSQGILSGDPSKGLAAYEGTLRTPYERELADWKTKVGAAGEAAGLEEKELANDMDYVIRTGQLENTSRYNEIRASEAATRATQAQNNYDVAIKRLDELIKSNADRKSIADATVAVNQAKVEVDRHQAESQRIQAEAAREQAVAAKTRAGAYGQYVGLLGAGKIPKPSDVNDMYNAEQDVLTEMMATDPRLREYFDFDPETGVVTPKMLDVEGLTPEQLAEREALMSMVGVRTQERLGGLAGGGAPPLWRMRPDAVIPPERRRIR